MEPHGRHIKVLGVADPTRLGSVSCVRDFLESLVGKLGMRPMGAAHMYEVEVDLRKLGVEPFEDEGGVTGVIVLSTSHCSIHTWPARPFFVLDVYSCRDFEPEVVELALNDAFGEGMWRVRDLSFSLIWPVNSNTPTEPAPPGA